MPNCYTAVYAVQSRIRTSYSYCLPILPVKHVFKCVIQLLSSPSKAMKPKHVWRKTIKARYGLESGLAAFLSVEEAFKYLGRQI